MMQHLTPRPSPTSRVRGRRAVTVFEYLGAGVFAAAVLVLIVFVIEGTPWSGDAQRQAVSLNDAASTVALRLGAASKEAGKPLDEATAMAEASKALPSEFTVVDNDDTDDDVFYIQDARGRITVTLTDKVGAMPTLSNVHRR